MKTSFSTKQWKAIRWYIEENNLLPRLSAYPTVRFERRDTGEYIEHTINYIEALYNQKEKVNA